MRHNDTLRQGMRTFGICLVAWAVFGLMNLGQDVTRRLYWDIPIPWQETGFWAIRVFLSAALTPIALWLGRRWPIERQAWRSRLGLHLLFAAGFALARALLEILAHMTLHPLWTTGHEWAATFGGAVAVLLIFGFHEGVIAYAVILLVQSAFRYHAQFQERAREALRLELQASELKGQLARAQLDTLKLQLQPHFLFNTLNAIVVLVRQKKGSQAEEALTRFSDLLRSVLDDKDAQEVPLHRELEYVRLYLSIEQMRFSDRLRVHVSPDPDVLDAAMPHMCLQPLVENAVRHGISRRAAGGTIELRARRQHDMLHVVVKDDGAGPARSPDTAGHGIGLANLRERLQQLYGEAARLDFAGGDGGGTVVTLAIPYRSLAGAGEETALSRDSTDERGRYRRYAEGTGSR